MIRVSVYRRSPDRTIRRFEVTGHAEFAERGKDIVCAGVSAVTVGTVNAIEALTDLELDCEMRDGDLRVSIPERGQAESGERVQLLLESMLVMLDSIQQSYGQYIRIQQFED